MMIMLRILTQLILLRVVKMITTRKKEENLDKSLHDKPKWLKVSKPAAHMGIPYRLYRPVYRYWMATATGPVSKGHDLPEAEEKGPEGAVKVAEGSEKARDMPVRRGRSWQSGTGPEEAGDGRRRRSRPRPALAPFLQTTDMSFLFSDYVAVNLQDVHSEATQIKEELQLGALDVSRKTDLIILVHNLSRQIPQHHQLNSTQLLLGLSLVLNEAKALGIPWVLAITNKYSVSGHQQKMLVSRAMEAYDTSPSTIQVVNSCPFSMRSAARDLQLLSSTDSSSRKAVASRRISFALLPFQRKDVMPVEGITELRQLVHCVLCSREEMAFFFHPKTSAI